MLQMFDAKKRNRILSIRVMSECLNELNFQ